MRKKHGLSGTRVYKIWSNMKRRCSNQKEENFVRYGGRGITVCEEWKNDFMSFYNWAMENGYHDSLTLDRKDNNGNYEPGNCRWATVREQGNNRGEFNINITYQGRTQTLMQWAEELGLPFATLRYRIVESNWPIEEAFTIGIGAISSNPNGTPPIRSAEEKARVNKRRKELYWKNGKLPRDTYLEKKKEEKEKSIKRIEEELAKNPGLSTRKMAEKLGFSRSYVQRIYTLLKERSPHE